MAEENQIEDGSGDRKYFTITPRLVGLLCRDPYEYTLWGIIKEIAGENGECYLSTPDLAALAMQSAGKVSQARRRLIKIGLLGGEIRRDPSYPQPVWHLRIPDLWSRNMEFVQEMPLLKDRIEFKRQQKKSFHQVKPSPHERGLSPGERGLSPGEEGIPPGETKKNHIRTILEPLVDPITAPIVAESPETPPENSSQSSPSESIDYLTHCADLSNNASGKSWTVPPAAGGADSLGEAMLAAWLERKGVAHIPDKLRSKWEARMSKLAWSSGLVGVEADCPALTTEQAALAVEIVLEPDSTEFGYYTYNDPANRKFQQDWTEVALRLLNGGNGRRDDGAGKDLYSEAGQAAQAQRLAKRGFFLDEE